VSFNIVEYIELYDSIESVGGIKALWYSLRDL